MFTQQPTRTFRRQQAFFISALLHIVVLAWLVRQPRPIFVKPSLLAHGIWQNSSVVYIAEQKSPETIAGSREVPRARSSAVTYVRRNRQKRSPETQEVRVAQAAAQSPQQPSTAGSPYGSQLEGLALGHEVRPALPLIFPDPPIARSELPVEARGDVIIEVTIDVLGNVIGTKLLQGIGYGIDEVVVSTVQKWRFRPATQDGTAIPSQQDVYFHFPT